MEALQVVFESGMAFEEMWDRVEERQPRFREVPGLLQKVYLRDPGSQEVAGLYLFENEESLEAYLDSDLRESIAGAYDVQGEPDVRRWTVAGTLFPLGEEAVSGAPGEEGG